MRLHRVLPILSLLMAAWAAPSPPASAQEGRPDLEDLSFMSGCWHGSFRAGEKEGVIEEHYTTPSRNVLLGTTRYLLEGRAVQFELTSIRRESDGNVFLQPYPGGEPSPARFELTRLAPGEAVFEAPGHDFPKRIVYRLKDERLVARVDGGEGSDRVQEWEMARARCVPGS